MERLKLPRIILDLDGVVVDFFQRLIAVYNKRYPDDMITVEDINCELEQLGPERASRFIDIFNEPGWFIELKSLPGAINIVSHYASAGHHILVCTAPARYQDGKINGMSAAEKFDWIQRHLPAWGHKISITRDKEFVDGDILVDDTPHNIIKWCDTHPEGIGVLVDQPWNSRWIDLPRNAIRADLQDVGAIMAHFWCKETEKFAYRAHELRNWKNAHTL